MNKKFAQFVFLAFVVESVMIICIHSFGLGYGLKMDMTISKYVGLDYWSAGVFLLVNAVIAGVWGRYANQVAREWGMSWLWRVLAVAAAVLLVVLSVCPMGLFDRVPGEYSLVSRLHRLSSSTMFATMVMTDMGLCGRVRRRWFRAYSAVYAVYGLIMAVCFFSGNEWFWGHTLVLETAFIVGYLVMLCMIPRRGEIEGVKGAEKSESVV